MPTYLFDELTTFCNNTELTQLSMSLHWAHWFIKQEQGDINVNIMRFYVINWIRSNEERISYETIVIYINSFLHINALNYIMKLLLLSAGI